MKGNALNVKSSKVWKMMNWGEVEKKYPSARVLKRGQTMSIPNNWPHFDKVCN